MTADRIAHYQQVSGGGEELKRMFQDFEPAHPFALSLQGLFPQLAAVQAQQAGLSALGDSVGFGHQQVGFGLDVIHNQRKWHLIPSCSPSSQLPQLPEHLYWATE